MVDSIRFFLGIALAIMVAGSGQAQEKTEKPETDDPIGMQLAKAKEEFQKTLSLARSALTRACDDEENRILANAKLGIEEKIKRVDALRSEKQRFEEEGTLPRTGALKAVVSEYQSKVSVARSKIDKAFIAAAEKYAAKDFERAKAILEERKGIQEGSKLQLKRGGESSIPMGGSKRGLGTARTLSGVWRIEDDDLLQTSLDPACMIVFGDVELSKYDMSFQAMAEKGTHGFKVLFHVQPNGNRCEFALGNYGNKWHDIFTLFDGKGARPDGMIVAGTIDQGRWYDVAVKVRGPKFTCCLDSKELFSTTDERFSSGFVGISTWNSASRFRNIRIVDKDGKVLYSGLPKLSGPNRK